jgi:hypothetical protein
MTIIDDMMITQALGTDLLSPVQPYTEFNFRGYSMARTTVQNHSGNTWYVVLVAALYLFADSSMRCVLSKERTRNK